MMPSGIGFDDGVHAGQQLAHAGCDDHLGQLAAGLQALGEADSSYRPGAQAAPDDDLVAFCRQHGATIFHPVGTCKMGGDAMAVVDARQKVLGLTGLRVVECSIMPTLVSGNTHPAAVMIGEKAADMILEDTHAS